MQRYDDERAPLEFTSVSKKQKIVGCPNCKTARSVSINWCSGICSVCHNYFNEKTALGEDECTAILNQEKPIDKEFTKLKGEMERKAYDYKEKVMDKKKHGLLRKHEPGDDGYWQKNK